MTDKDIQQAKKFLRQRLDAEQSASRNLETELVIFATALLNLYKKYGYTPSDIRAENDTRFQYELQILIRKFKDALYDDIETLCVGENEEKRNQIIAYINQPILGITLKSRISNWVSQFISAVNNNIEKGLMPHNLITIRMGAGYGINRLMRQTIADSKMHEWKEMHPQAVGFYSYRGSSYSCSYCDSMVGYHPIAEYPSYGDWHPSCCCYFVFVNEPPK